MFYSACCDLCRADSKQLSLISVAPLPIAPVCSDSGEQSPEGARIALPLSTRSGFKYSFAVGVSKSDKPLDSEVADCHGEPTAMSNSRLPAGCIFHVADSPGSTSGWQPRLGSKTSSSAWSMQPETPTSDSSARLQVIAAPTLSIGLSAALCVRGRDAQVPSQSTTRCTSPDSQADKGYVESSGAPLDEWSSEPSDHGNRRPSLVLNQHLRGVSVAGIEKVVAAPSHANQWTGFAQSISPILGEQEGQRVAKPSRLSKEDSQAAFTKRTQTVVVFDWDDTLFPTTYIQQRFDIDWSKPVNLQKSCRTPARFANIRKNLMLCEDQAIAILKKASELAHVVVVTLASRGWVEKAFDVFPRVGQLLVQMQVPVLYARDDHVASDWQSQSTGSATEAERYWGAVKGRTISRELDRFYSQYEGQSWKNVISIGDSCFERYGLLAASSAYMQGGRLEAWQDSVAPNPSEEICWQSETDGRVLKLRVKCCKLLSQPSVAELSLQLEVTMKWLPWMVALDQGFDMDLQVLADVKQVEVIEAVLQKKLPVSALPQRLARPHKSSKDQD